MRSFAILALASSGLVAALPKLTRRNIEVPVSDADPAIAMNAALKTPFTSLPANACGSADWFYSASSKTRAPNSFHWLYVTGTCQSIDQTPGGATSSVNRPFVDSSSQRGCSGCDFFFTADCSGEMNTFYAGHTYSAVESVNKVTQVHGNDVGYNSWQCYAPS